MDTKARRIETVLWIVVTLLVLSILGTVSVFLFFRLLKGKAAGRSVAVTATTNNSSAKGAFATSFRGLAEADVPGRYRITDGDKVMYVYLNEDHSFINTDGTTYPPYLWQVAPDSFTITWQRSSSVYTEFERPGVYARHRTDGRIARMEKLPDLPPADTIVFPERDVVASMALDSTIQSNGLVLANVDGDGAIEAGDVQGEVCYRLKRLRSRMSAFLYARIAPELKQERFTNAFIVVEYFDVPTRDLRNGWITVQYDARDGPYTSTAQRVQLMGSMNWRRATFVLEAPVFEGRQNDSADFRLCVANSELPIRSLKLVKNRPLPTPATTAFSKPSA